MKQHTLNLYTSYLAAIKPKKEQGVLHSWYLPILSTLLVCFAIVGVITYIGHKTSSELEAVTAWNTDPVNVEAYEHSLERQEYNQQIIMTINEVQRLNNTIAGYPRVDAALLRSLTNLGAAEVTTRISGYDAVSGSLAFVATSEKVIDIPGYIVLLENTGYFDSVNYQGYSYNDGIYTLTVSAALTVSLGK